MDSISPLFIFFVQSLQKDISEQMPDRAELRFSNQFSHWLEHVTRSQLHTMLCQCLHITGLYYIKRRLYSDGEYQGAMDRLERMERDIRMKMESMDATSLHQPPAVPTKRKKKQISTTQSSHANTISPPPQRSHLSQAIASPSSLAHIDWEQEEPCNRD